MSDPIVELIERQGIVDVLQRYATALDSRQWQLLHDVFTEDAVFEIGAAVGQFHGPAEIGDLVASFLGGLQSSQHMLTNFAIAIDGDRATSTCYLHAQHYLPGQLTGGNTLEIGGTYHDRLIKTDAGWRIAQRELEVTWTEGNAGVQHESRARAAASS